MKNTNCLTGLRCPHCGNVDRFFISGECDFDVTDEGSVAFGDHEWDEDSACKCSVCGVHKTVEYFQFSGKLHVPIVIVKEDGKLRGVLSKSKVNPTVYFVDLDDLDERGQGKAARHNLGVLEDVCLDDQSETADFFGLEDLLEDASEIAESLEEVDDDAEENDYEGYDGTFVPVNFDATKKSPESVDLTDPIDGTELP